VRRRLASSLTAGVVALLAASTAQPAVHPLRVSPDRRHLVDANGAPFLYLGDTAWQLFHLLTREEAQRYLEDRARKGFTVVQAVVLGLSGLDVPNAYGEPGLVGKDPRRPNEAYFAHVDWIVDKAGELGLTVGLLPTWGDVWHSRNHDPGPKVFDAANALEYSRFIGRRYRNRPVIFILGGDRNPETEGDRAIVRAMPAGLRETAPERLVTYHPRGPGRSSDMFHREDWLDFDMIQSSHAGRGADTGLTVQHDRALEPPKPTLEGEPRYESIIVGFYNDGADPAVRFDDYDVRLAAYRNLLAAPRATRTATTTSGRCGLGAASPSSARTRPGSRLSTTRARSRWATSAGSSSRGPGRSSSPRRTSCSDRTHPATASYAPPSHRTAPSRWSTARAARW
jgi:Protein of unknown function (DUF4038)